MNEERHVVQAGGIAWNVVVRGTGPVLLAVHGTGSSNHSFAPLAAELGCTVIAPDLPGHGGTPPEPGAGPALPAFARGLATVLERLDARPTVAVGHSAGAAVVAWMMLEGSLSAHLCVGLGAAFVPFDPPRQTLARLSARVLARSGVGRGLARVAPVMSRFMANAEGLPPAQAEVYRRLAADPDHVDGVLRMLARWDASPLFDRLDAVPGRWLLVSGETDSVVPTHHQRLAASRIPDVRHAILPGGHLIHEAKATLVAGEIARELTSLPPFV